MTSIAKQARSIRNLEKAWSVIRANGFRSTSKRTRNEIDQFSQVSGTGLRKIQTLLRQQSFDFGPSLGIPIDRGAAKQRRPLVISPLPSRIVQRSIHDCLINIPEIRAFVENENSFGGTKRRDDDGRSAVPAAISETVKEIKNGSKFYIRSDIKSFFTKIPKPAVLKIINKYVADKESRDLIKNAIYIELENMSKLRIQGHDGLFPIEDIGVAQGNCLSPLLGNILLHKFDQIMSDDECRCLRYIDDFIILGSSKKNVFQRFRKINEFIENYDMTTYDPRKDSDKADKGPVENGIEFLGVDIKNGLIRPSKKSRRRLISRIDEVLQDSINAMKNRDEGRINQKFSLTKTFLTINGIARGWAEQYSYCNERNVFQNLDEQINKSIGIYLGKYSDLRTDAKTDEIKRRMLGVALLTDSEGQMIKW